MDHALPHATGRARTPMLLALVFGIFLVLIGVTASALVAVARPDDTSEDPAEVSLGPLGVIDGITVWAIPGAVIGGPGLLVILWVAIQTGAALAWIPAVRRMRGRDSDRPLARSRPPRAVVP